jgi:hypothetical protein
MSPLLVNGSSKTTTRVARSGSRLREEKREGELAAVAGTARTERSGAPRQTFHPSDDASLPGDVEFALHYRVLGEDYWDKCAAEAARKEVQLAVKLRERWGRAPRRWARDLELVVRYGAELLPSLHSGIRDWVNVRTHRRDI